MPVQGRCNGPRWQAK